MHVASSDVGSAIRYQPLRYVVNRVLVRMTKRACRLLGSAHVMGRVNNNTHVPRSGDGRLDGLQEQQKEVRVHEGTLAEVAPLRHQHQQRKDLRIEGILPRAEIRV